MKKDRMLNLVMHAMKHMILFCGFAFMLLFTPRGIAITEQEWNEKCWTKTTETVTLYDVQYDDNGIPQLTAIGSIPSNTYIRSGKDDLQNRIMQVYYYKNGTTHSAYMKVDNNIANASLLLHIDNGTVTKVPEAMLKNPTALLNYLNQSAPQGVTYSLIPGTNKVHAEGKAPIIQDGAYADGSTPYQGANSSASTNPSTQKTQKAIKDDAVVRYSNEAVHLIRLGVATSTVLLNGEEKEVPTFELDFGSTAEKEKQVAVIHAPKTGKCTLRAKASDSGKALQKCKAGTVVIVLEYGRNFCKISDDGDVGYVQTDCLKWYDAETEGTGLLSYNGRTTGSTTINVRNTPSGDSAKIAEWETGTQVEVFGLEKGWYEIEYKGIHGFVMEKFLTVEK